MDAFGVTSKVGFESREKYDTAFMSMIYFSGEGELGALNVKANIQGAPHRGSDNQSTEKLAARDHVKMLLLVGNARVLFSGISIAADRSGREDSNLCQVTDLVRGDSDNATRKRAIAGQSTAVILTSQELDRSCSQLPVRNAARRVGRLTIAKKSQKHWCGC